MLENENYDEDEFNRIINWAIKNIEISLSMAVKLGDLGLQAEAQYNLGNCFVIKTKHDDIY